MENEELRLMVATADDHFRHGRMNEALEAYKAVLELDPGIAWVYSRMGAILAQREEIDAAAEYLEKALEVDPELPQAHSNLGNVYFTRGDYKKAEECYRTATRLDPENPLYHENLHAALKKQGRYSEAVKELKTSHRKLRTVANDTRDAEVKRLKSKIGCTSVIAITVLLVAAISVVAYIL